MLAPELVPSYWASVSGGKDSLYMLQLILDHPNLYPLDGVVHFKLEIDFPFIADVVEIMRAKCAAIGVPFVCIRPRTSWYDLYDQYGFPTRKARWCNSRYKLDAKKQLQEFLKTRGKRCVSYIGFCADEVKRFKSTSDQVYPLADFGIMEQDILDWARELPVYNQYYKYNRRCGCMYCPLMSIKSMAYLAAFYPDHYRFYMSAMAKTERVLSEKLGRPFAITQSKPKYNAEYLDARIRSKYLPEFLAALENRDI